MSPDALDDTVGSEQLRVAERDVELTPQSSAAVRIR